jgi:hypothetical protein
MPYLQEITCAASNLFHQQYPATELSKAFFTSTNMFSIYLAVSDGAAVDANIVSTLVDAMLAFRSQPVCSLQKLNQYVIANIQERYRLNANERSRYVQWFLCDEYTGRPAGRPLFRQYATTADPLCSKKQISVTDYFLKAHRYR